MGAVAFGGVLMVHLAHGPLPRLLRFQLQAPALMEEGEPPFSQEKAEAEEVDAEA